MRANPSDTSGWSQNLPADYEPQVDVEATVAAVVEVLRPRGWLSTGTVAMGRDADRVAMNVKPKRR